MTVELGHGIRLLSGVLFDYGAPEKCEVKIEDIAAALSKVCRFAGHIHRFYSVAQHAVNVSLQGTRREDRKRDGCKVRFPLPSAARGQARRSANAPDREDSSQARLFQLERA